MGLCIWRGNDAALGDVVDSRIIGGACRVLDIWRVQQSGSAGLVRLSKLREHHIAAPERDLEPVKPQILAWQRCWMKLHKIAKIYRELGARDKTAAAP
jgi:hypothetical protein